MVIEQVQLVDAEHGLLDRTIFSSEELYPQELERVFGRTWLFIGHDSLVPNPNDFFLTYMGEDPVILTRDAKGEVHAFLNMCRHRGNRVARADDGNAKNFMCTYHGWTYSNDGKLVSVPGLQEAYYGELEVDKLGLIAVAQLDSYAGFIFATWDAEAPSLEDYLGDMRWYMDTYLNRRDGGMELIGPDKWIIPTNWKMPAENFGGDNYHVHVSHRSAVLAMAKFGRFRDPGPGIQVTPGFSVAPGMGHNLSMLSAGDAEDSAPIMERIVRHPVQAAYLHDTMPEVERRLGTLRGRRLLLGVGNIFPNTSLHIFNNLIRTWHPRGPYETEVWAFIAIEKEMPQEGKDIIRTMSQRTFNPSGMFEQDDMDNWRQCTESGKSMIGRRVPQQIRMGLGREGPHDVLPGLVHTSNMSEATHRGMYSAWQQFMNAEAWKDIPVSPRTATYEGTATFKG